MQNRKRDTDLQNSHLDSMGEGEGGMFQEQKRHLEEKTDSHGLRKNIRQELLG